MDEIDKSLNLLFRVTLSGAATQPIGSPIRSFPRNCVALLMKWNSRSVSWIDFVLVCYLAIAGSDHVSSESPRRLNIRVVTNKRNGGSIAVNRPGFAGGSNS
jgi:hypothetical protein